MEVTKVRSLLTLPKMLASFCIMRIGGRSFTMCAMNFMSTAKRN